MNPAMTPAPGDRLLRFVGDRVRFVVRDRDGRRPPKDWQARLRTNLGRADLLRREIIQAHAKGVPLAGISWQDLPMRPGEGGWSLELPLNEVGFFKAKAYLLDNKGWQHWPDGPDTGISVHPDSYRTANTIYCAFPRMFGPGKTAISTRNERLENQIQQIEQHGFTIIPPSGKLRDLIQALPHIVDVLGCRILHLLPVHPTPTTYARFGRFGSPYAALNLSAIDPALVEFDRRTTGIDQFRELTYAMHLRGGRVFLDIVINHTGWGSILQEEHPEWFVRNPDGTFASPGAWGVVWEDLAELKHGNVALWDQLADMFLLWCRRGVDGFRCDAGYKVPVSAWQYIIARVQQEFPATIFLLEGLGGSWEATEALLTEGGMQWAYSELFQNYSGSQVAGYLDYSKRQSDRVGLYVHYSETHDNDRLARQGRAWSLLRNRLSALTSASGGFGFTCGVEWLATEKIRVHDSTGMAWGAADNIVAELSQLNRLLHEHPCFFDGAKLTRLSPPDAPVLALLRECFEGNNRVLVLVNTDVASEQRLTLSRKDLDAYSAGETSMDQPGQNSELWTFDLLGQASPRVEVDSDNVQFTVAPGAAHCLSASASPVGAGVDEYRRQRARAAWAVQMISREIPVQQIGPFDWRELSKIVDRCPYRFLSCIRHLDPAIAENDLSGAIARVLDAKHFPQVIRWSLVDRRRITLVPPEHWLLIEDTAAFRATLSAPGAVMQHVESIFAGGRFVACFPPGQIASDASLQLERYAESDPRVEAVIRFLPSTPANPPPEIRDFQADQIVLLTNGIGGMARICVDLGCVRSKYDCVLGANLHSEVPVDRHVFVKRIRVWVNADGFISPLDFKNLQSLRPDPPAAWNFVADAGDGRSVEIGMQVEMLEGRNTTVFHFNRPTAGKAGGKQLPSDADVRLTVRFDIEDRNFHTETRRNGGAEHHFSSNTFTLSDGRNESRAAAKGKVGFTFAPSSDRQLCVFATQGEYHPQPEWSENIPHPVEQTRGQVGSGDAYSPGWFELSLPKGASASLVVTAENEEAAVGDLKLELGAPEEFGQHLAHAARAYIVRRGSGKTVIAGYPWFLDWGRDTLICARGLLAGGFVEEVRQILQTFAKFEEGGTLPNTIHGEDASNRDTTDAPLWFGVVAEELAAIDAAVRPESDTYDTIVDRGGRTIRDVLRSIANGYIGGTSNGIQMDAESGLVWSPSHFTWMDTNFPAGTPREGYPVEIQALWIRLLRQLSIIADESERERWRTLAALALESFEKFFWLEDQGYYADVLLARRGRPPGEGSASDALRSNELFPVALGLVTGDRARRSVMAALRYLVVPGALRTLAPLPVKLQLPVVGNHGGLLNDPSNPYWPRYEGDEDTCRKPAYHNGTAWTWTFPVFCEALARAWRFSPESVDAARAYLGSVDRLLNGGCLGHLPEVLDGDAPHVARGCDAQAWGMTELLRVWKLLGAG